MSGGAFDYQQYVIDRIAREIEQVIIDNDNGDLDEWGDTVGRFFDPATLRLLLDAARCLRRAAIYAQRADWMLSGDDSPESFATRLGKELARERIEWCEFKRDIVGET